MLCNDEFLNVYIARPVCWLQLSNGTLLSFESGCALLLAVIARSASQSIIATVLESALRTLSLLLLQRLSSQYPTIAAIVAAADVRVSKFHICV